MQRFWLYERQIVTSRDLKRAGLSPLRAVDLGRLAGVAAARIKARRHARQSLPVVIARNVRLACDSGRGARSGLSKDQIMRLRNGEVLQMEDSAGRFTIGYQHHDGGGQLP